LRRFHTAQQICRLRIWRDTVKKGARRKPDDFLHLPGAFEKEIAQNFNHKQFAEVLKNSGMLTPPTSGRGYQRKSPRIDGRQFNVYVLHYAGDQPARRMIFHIRSFGVGSVSSVGSICKYHCF
jgi:hypothetical protein